MLKISCPNGRGFIEFERTDFVDENGSGSVGFRWKASSMGFTAELSDLWVYSDELVEFGSQLEHLLAGKGDSVTLSAMSDFSLNIAKQDSLGHFQVSSEMSSPVFGNEATLVVEFETQSVVNLKDEMVRASEK